MKLSTRDSVVAALFAVPSSVLPSEVVEQHDGESRLLARKVRGEQEPVQSFVNCRKGSAISENTTIAVALTAAPRSFRISVPTQPCSLRGRD